MIHSLSVSLAPPGTAFNTGITTPGGDREESQ